MIMGALVAPGGITTPNSFDGCLSEGRNVRCFERSGRTPPDERGAHRDTLAGIRWHPLVAGRIESITEMFQLLSYAHAKLG